MTEKTITVTERVFRDGYLVATPGDELTERRAAELGIKADGTKDQSIADAPDIYAKTKAEMRGLDGELLYPPAEPSAAEKKAAAKAEKEAADAAAKLEEERVAQEQADQEAQAAADAEAARTAAGGTSENAAGKPSETA